MKQQTERKIQFIVNNWQNGNEKDAAKKVNSLTKHELFMLVSSHNQLACPELIGDKHARICLENFVCNSLEGMYK